MKALTSLVNPGDDLKARKTPEFMGHAVEALEMIEATSKKPRPLGINKDLLLESSVSSPFFAEAIKKAWFVHMKVSGMDCKVKREHGDLTYLQV